jgi:hypothetical protein
MTSNPAKASHHAAGNTRDRRRDDATGRQACEEAAAQADTARVAMVAFYADPAAAHRHLDLLLNNEAPMDRVSVLGRADASGDDPLGLYYASAGERMRGWGKLGAFWGGIFGLLGGAAGLFVLPGVGTVMAAGPLVGSLTGAAAGAGAGGVLMAGAGAGQQLAVAIHRLGIPESCLGDMQERLARGETLLMLIMDPDEAARWRPLLEATPSRDQAGAGAQTSDLTSDPAEQTAAAAAPLPGPVALWQLPFTGVADAIREQL